MRKDQMCKVGQKDKMWRRGGGGYLEFGSTVLHAFSKAVTNKELSPLEICRKGTFVSRGNKTAIT